VKPKLQPELHPDADTLNAFAERALQEPERARVLAHLGDCAGCREVVYLAQAAEAELVPATAHPRPGWIAVAFARWRVVLIPAAALAAVAGVVLWIQLHPAPPRTQMAQMIAPPASLPTAPPTAATTAHSVKPLPPPAGPAPIRREHKTRTASGTGLAATEEVAQNKPVPAPSGSMAVEGPPAAAFNARSAAKFAQPRINHEWQQQAAISPAAASRPFQAPPPPAPVPPNLATVHGAVIAPASGSPEPVAAQAPRMALTTESLNEVTTMRLARRVRLPSGLIAVSSAALLHRLVAIDSAGSVFFSQDSGKHWEPVHPLWAGKAIAVEATPESPDAIAAAAQAASSEPVRLAVPTPPDSQNKNAEAPPAPDQAEASPPVPPMLFRLVTDRHRTWVSADGRLWREQP
jgi:hypothetical protein